MNPGKKNSNLLKNTGIHFLEFALGTSCRGWCDKRMGNGWQHYEDTAAAF